MTQILSVKTKLPSTLPQLGLQQRRIFQAKNMLQDYLKLAVMFQHVYCTRLLKYHVLGAATVTLKIWMDEKKEKNTFDLKHI